jgi:hypothetical protein
MFMLVLVGGARAAHAQDAFEIQVYDAETAQRWHPGLEVHANYVIAGTAAAPPVLATDEVFHLTFEPHFGVADWAEVGAYLQTALRPDGSYDYAGVKARAKARLPHARMGGVGLALNLEVSALPRAYAEARYGMELRPIADFSAERVYLSANPILDIDFEGALAGRPQFEPAVKAAFLPVPHRLGVGAEYYGALGSVVDPLPLSRQNHRLFAALDLAGFRVGSLTLAANCGVGYGLAAGERWIAKLIVSVDAAASGGTP